MRQVRRVKRLQLSHWVMRTYRKPLKVPGLETQQSGKTKDNFIQPLSSMKVHNRDKQSAMSIAGLLCKHLKFIEVTSLTHRNLKLQLKLSAKETLVDGVSTNGEKTFFMKTGFYVSMCSGQAGDC